MNKKVCCLVSVFLILVVSGLVVGSVRADVGGVSDFTAESVTGQWDTCSWNMSGASRLNISSHAPDEGDSRWVQADYPGHVSPAFYGYYARIKFVYLNAEPSGWWQPQIEKSVTFLWNFSNVFICLKLANQVNWGGWLNNWWVNYGSSTNCSSFTGDWYNWASAHFAGREHWNYDNDVFDVYVQRLNETYASLTIFKGITNGYDYNMEYVYGANVTVDSGWWGNATLSFQVGHSGNGRFSAIMDNIVYAYAPPSAPTEYSVGGNENLFVTFVSNLYHFATGVLPSGWRSQIDTIVGYGGFFGAIVGVLLVFLGAIIPILPAILIFSAIGVGVACVEDGSFEPMRDFASMIISLSTGVVHTLVAIAQTIYDFIHFW